MISYTDRTLIRTLIRTLALSLALLASACGASGKYVWVHDRPREPVTDRGLLLIGPGDLLEVQVYGDEQTSTTGRVLADGTISLPLLGSVHVVGQRADELAHTLEQHLKRFIQVPKVTVLVRESVVSVSVIGEVRDSGVFSLVGPATVLEALAEAGGLTEFADGSCIFVLRSEGQNTARIRFTYDALVKGEAASSTFYLKSGDVVVVD